MVVAGCDVVPRLDRLAHVGFMNPMFTVCSINIDPPRYMFNLMIVMFTFLMTGSFVRGRRCPS